MPEQCSNQLSYEVTQSWARIPLSHLNFSGSWDNCLNCPASARIISSFDFKHRTSYNISFVIFGNKDVLADNQKLEEQKSEVQVQAGENILNFVDYSEDPKLEQKVKITVTMHCTIDCLSIINVRWIHFFVHFYLQIKYCCYGLN